MKNAFRTASLLMLLVAAFLLSAITTMHFAIHGAEVTIPDLKGMTVTEARSQTSGLGLNLDVDNRYYSSQVAAGHILTQSPAPGTVVRRAWSMRVSESLGPQKVDVPQTVGSDQRVASMRLQRAGLEIGEVATIPMDGVTQGTVIAQDPPAHAHGIEQPSVNLLVAAASDETADGFVMPDVKGLPIVTAQSKLQRAGLKTSTPQFVDVPRSQTPSQATQSSQPAANQGAPTLEPGTVIAQKPIAGGRVDASIGIVLTVAK
ncbi:MAG: PASTA domain-containing protein [Acidobacteriota bacterium]|nr:PASTA domain-containing protein [Acidobacteriota bacterium]